jgi:DNA recombination protein RmuC
MDSLYIILPPTCLLIAVLVLLLVVVFRKPQDVTAVMSPIQGLAQTASALQTELGVLAERVSPIQSLTQTTSSLQAELKALSERVSTIEHGQNALSQTVVTVATKLAETGSLTQGLADTASAIRSGLASAQESLAAIQSHAAARQQMEEQTAESIRRLEAVIAGTSTKGTAGENIVEMVFAQLPPEWQVRNFQVGNRTVEFGLRLPNNLVLPIDSKWTATNLLEQFLACEDEEQRRALKSQIERIVLAKAREVRRYIDPSVTVNFGIAAVPDAVFDLCTGVQADTLQLNVVLVSYSMFVPYLLLAFQTILKTSRDVDLHKLSSYVETAQQTISDLQEEIEGRLSKAITMLGNSRDGMRVQVSKINTALAAIQLGAGTGQTAEMLPPRAAVGT